jgi:hypothetical protein
MINNKIIIQTIKVNTIKVNIIHNDNNKFDISTINLYLESTLN